jgi:cholesterol transport system auxiliary component
MKKPFCLLSCVTLSLLLAGCLSKPALVGKNFAFQIPTITNSVTVNGVGTLVVPPVEVSPLFSKQALVYRIGPNEYETDPYAGFLVLPDQSLTIPIRGYLANSGLFANVVWPDSLIKPDKVLQVYVTELYGDFRDARQPTAVLAMRVVFANFGGDVVLQKEYSRHLPVQKNTAAAVVAGWNQALGEIMEELASDLKSAPKSADKGLTP